MTVYQLESLLTRKFCEQFKKDNIVYPPEEVLNKNE